MTKLFGVGVNTRQYPSLLKDKHVSTPEYRLWHHMLQRCYNPKTQAKHPSYKGVVVSNNFKNFTYFYEWCHNQQNFGVKGFELDKDILGDGTIYSEDTCAFVPIHINKLLVLRGAARGELPLGVTHISKGGYIARLNKGKTREYLGYFKTPEQAYKCYLTAKHAYIKQLANEYKHSLDGRVYNQLLKIDLENLK